MICPACLKTDEWCKCSKYCQECGCHTNHTTRQHQEEEWGHQHIYCRIHKYQGWSDDTGMCPYCKPEDFEEDDLGEDGEPDEEQDADLPFGDAGDLADPDPPLILPLCKEGAHASCVELLWAGGMVELCYCPCHAEEHAL